MYIIRSRLLESIELSFDDLLINDVFYGLMGEKRFNPSILDKTCFEFF